MFRRILIPTDGSVASMAAVDRATGAAHGSGARAMGLFVTPRHCVPGAHADDEAARQCFGSVERRDAVAQVEAEVLTRGAVPVLPVPPSPLLAS